MNNIHTINQAGYDLKDFAPIDLSRYASLNQTQAHERTSSKYSFIPTTRVLDVLQCNGWTPIKVHDSKARTETNKGFQKHMIRLANPSLPKINGAYPIINLVNSHMGTSAFQMMLGMYRLVCRNGLCVGSDWQSYSIRHVGYTDGLVEDAIRSISLSVPKMLEGVEAWSGKQLSTSQKQAYNQAVIELTKTSETTYEVLPVGPGEENTIEKTVDYAINPRSLPTGPGLRYGDDSSLWTHYNNVQESIIKGYAHVKGSDGSSRKMRAVKSIDRDINLNRALWTLTEKMASLM